MLFSLILVLMLPLLGDGFVVSGVSKYHVVLGLHGEQQDSCAGAILHAPNCLSGWQGACSLLELWLSVVLNVPAVLQSIAPIYNTHVSIVHLLLSKVKDEVVSLYINLQMTRLVFKF